MGCMEVFLAVLIVSQCIDGRNGAEKPSDTALLRHVREANDDCIWNLTVSGNGGTLTSPNYPNAYPKNTDCRWLLTSADPNTSIFLRIDKLRIEPDTDCKLDYLQVYLGPTTLAPSLGPYCGSINDRILKTNSSALLIIFHSDPVYEDEGFFIDYFTQPAEDCQTKLTGVSGTLVSPRYPENYPDNTDCWTLITVNQDKKISVIFDTLDLEYGENCTFDYVQLFDGATRESSMLGQVCRRRGVTTFESSGNNLLLHFHSDSSVNRKGYRATYSSIDKDSSPLGECLWESEEGNGTVASPNYPLNYPSFSNCSIWLTSPEDHWIYIVFDALQLEIETNCSYDYLQIKEGSWSNSTILGTFCGKATEPKNLTSTKNKVQIIFQSDDFAEFSGFKLRYWFRKNSTEPEIETANRAGSFEKVIFDSVPENATLKIGMSHLLRCSTKHPVAKIRWLKNDQFLAGSNPLPGLKLLSNNSLWIQSMDLHLAGVYKCAAVTAEDTAQANAYVSVENDSANNDSTCAIVFRKVPKESAFAEGEFAHLECLAAGTHVQLSWEKDGQPLQRNERITLVRNGFLFLDKVAPEDAGVYSCIAYDNVAQCRKRASAVLNVSHRAKIEEICGRPKVNQPSEIIPQSEHAKIVGGHNTKKGAYPWQVMLWEPTLKSFCGGTLLNERWIATAAHCFENYKNLRWDRVVIKLGKYDTQHEKEPEEFRTGIADPSSIIVHPAYSKFTFDNDLALVRLRNHVRFTDYILPICLGDKDLGESLLNVDGDPAHIRKGIVTGWGKLKHRGSSPRFLQEIQLPVIEQSACLASTNYTVSRNMFCAGYAQETIGDACHGDSGGPFLMTHREKWYLIGIVSWGEGCGLANKYGFYTRIPNYIPWIKGIMKS